MEMDGCLQGDQDPQSQDSYSYRPGKAWHIRQSVIKANPSCLISTTAAVGAPHGILEAILTGCAGGKTGFVSRMADLMSYPTNPGEADSSPAGVTIGLD